jgi:hypothetical protein
MQKKLASAATEPAHQRFAEKDFEKDFPGCPERKIDSKIARIAYERFAANGLLFRILRTDYPPLCFSANWQRPSVPFSRSLYCKTSPMHL